MSLFCSPPNIIVLNHGFVICVVLQFYPLSNFYFSLFHLHFHIQQFSKSKGKLKLNHNIHLISIKWILRICITYWWSHCSFVTVEPGQYGHQRDTPKYLICLGVCIKGANLRENMWSFQLSWQTKQSIISRVHTVLKCLTVK